MPISSLGILIVALLGLVSFRGRISLALAMLLALAWTVAVTGPVGGLPFALVVTLAECALWLELGEILVASAPRDLAGRLGTAYHGFTGGLLGGVCLELAVGEPGTALGLAFAGAVASGLAGGAGLLPSLSAALLLPAAGPQNRSVRWAMLGALALAGRSR